MHKSEVDYYETLQLTRTASQQEIKQSYKRLALLHHPDKNSGTEQSKHKFRQISQAYTVLNDPKKRSSYDKYGVADLEGMDFEEFAESFQGFQEFLNQFLSFNSFEAMFNGMDKKKTKKGSKARGRAKGRAKNVSNKEMNQMAKMMMMGGLGGDDLDGGMEIAMLQALIAGGMIDADQLEQMQKQLQKIVLQSGDEDEEQDEDLTEEELQILEFGQKNVQKKKVGNKKKKKTETRCKLDGEKIEEDQILMHFSEKHMAEFKLWRQANGKEQVGTAEGEAKGKQQSKTTKEKEQQIQY